MPWLKILTLISLTADALDALGEIIGKLEKRKKERAATKKVKREKKALLDKRTADAAREAKDSEDNWP